MRYFPLFLAVILALLAWVGFSLVANVGAAPVNCSADPTLQPVEAEFLRLLNDYRAANGAGPLVNSPTMSRAAQWMANDLAAHPALFDHTDSTGRSFYQRMPDCGVVGPAGENIAGGQPSAAGTLAQWKSSPGHNANMLLPGWRSIGIGFAVGGAFGVSWVTDFGSVLQPDVPTPTPTPRACRYVGLPECVRLPQVAKD